MSKRPLSVLLLMLVIPTNSSGYPGCEWTSPGEPLSEYVAACATGTATVAVIWYTYLDVLAAGGGESYPTWAASAIGDVREVIEWQSHGRHTMDLSWYQRQDFPDKYWVVPWNSTDVGDQRAYLRSILPPGWNDDLDLEVWIGTEQTLNESEQGLFSGIWCDPTYYIHPSTIRIITGSLYEGSWTSYGHYFFTGIFLHEYGHALGFDHQTQDQNGQAGHCEYGWYFSCYDPMNPQGAIATCPQSSFEFAQGRIPFHIEHLRRLGWCQVDTIASDVAEYTLGDVRLYDRIVMLPTIDPRQYFLLVNYQNTLYDSVLNGRGMLVWHVLDYALLCVPEPNPLRGRVIDLEMPTGKWASSPTNAFCQATPAVPDPEAGADLLDCSSAMRSSAFWAGIGGSTAQLWQRFGPTTNPSSALWDTGTWITDDSRLNPQAVSAPFEIKNIRAVADPNYPGKYLIKFEVDMY